MRSNGIFRNENTGAGVVLPTPSHLAAFPLPRHEGNVGQVPNPAQFSERTDRGVSHQLSVLLSRYAIAPTGH